MKKSSANVQQWFAHYFLGLLAQSFNGAVATLSGLIAMDSTGQLAKGITFDAIWKTFSVALGVQAVLYFHAHPFPVLNPDTLTTTTTVDTAATSTVKTPIPAPTTSTTATPIQSN